MRGGLDNCGHKTTVAAAVVPEGEYVLMVESATVVTRFVPGAASTSAIGSWVKQATWSVSVGSVHGADAVGDGSGSGGEYARARYVMVDVPGLCLQTFVVRTVAVVVHMH